MHVSLSELPGFLNENNVKSTMVYNHVLNRGVRGKRG
jgi:hypothetical protein